MTSYARWSQIKQLFTGFQEQSDDRREVWLTAQCAGDDELLAEVRSLLAAQSAAPGIFDDGAAGVLKCLRENIEVVDLVGKHIGSYRLLKLIGEGGMGSVFLAERKNGEFIQQVALKIVRSDFVSAETRTRFTREHNFLARLVHPNIAQLHDGGVAEHTPYFTLEYVEGEPITTYCDTHRLDVRQRLELALQVCSAVTYAHRNLIVHRDLKPSNILVTSSGEAKLLDFGIAKLLDAEPAESNTATHGRMMTPEYAAPEQVLGGPITTATDVYAIGVIVYKLLCGRMPYPRADAGMISWAKGVIEESPESLNRALNRTTGRVTSDTLAVTRGTSLMALRRTLRGDLDRIVQRALAKEPEARYPSVSALADDVRAFIDGRAITGGNRRYRLRKFVRRHWLPLVTAAAVLLVFIVSGVAIVWEARRVEHEARTTLAVKDFLSGLFTALDPNMSKGRSVSARELLDRGVQRVDGNRNLDPEQKAEIEGTLGRTYYQLGLFDQANKLQENAVQGLSATGEQPALLARTEAERADTLSELSDSKSAIALADDAEARINSTDEGSVVDRAQILHAQTRIAIEQRDFVKAKRYADAELKLVRDADVDPDLLFRALLIVASAEWGLADYSGSESHYREALARRLPTADPDDLNIAKARSNLAVTLQSESRYVEAERLEEQALATDEKALGAAHPVTMQVRRDLGLSYYHLGRYAQARSTLEQVAEAQRAKLGDAHPALAGTDINLGLVLIDSGDLDDAERTLSQAVSIFQTKYGRDHQGTRTALGDLAVVHTQQGKLDQAKAELLELASAEKRLRLNEADGYINELRLGDIERLQGNPKDAVDLQRHALETTQNKFGEHNRYAANAHRSLALALRDSGDTNSAEREFRAALASYAGYIPNGEHPLAATVRYELGLLLINRIDARAEGIRLLAEAADVREKFLGDDHPDTKRVRAALLEARRMPKT
jgi:serine/threonine protein kinase